MQGIGLSFAARVRTGQMSTICLHFKDSEYSRAKVQHKRAVTTRSSSVLQVFQKLSAGKPNSHSNRS